MEKVEMAAGCTMKEDAAGGHMRNGRSCVASWIHQLPWQQTIGLTHSPVSGIS